MERHPISCERCTAMAHRKISAVNLKFRRDMLNNSLIASRNQVFKVKRFPWLVTLRKSTLWLYKVLEILILSLQLGILCVSITGLRHYDLEFLPILLPQHRLYLYTLAIAVGAMPLARSNLQPISSVILQILSYPLAERTLQLHILYIVWILSGYDYTFLFDISSQFQDFRKSPVDHVVQDIHFSLSL